MDKLPLGISFYTFQIAAYIIDVYRGRVPVEKSFIRLGTYVTMFPQLIAGPIINYSEVRMALCSRTVTFEQFESGLKTLILGLGAKVITTEASKSTTYSASPAGTAGCGTQNDRIWVFVLCRGD